MFITLDDRKTVVAPNLDDTYFYTRVNKVNEGARWYQVKGSNDKSYYLNLTTIPNRKIFR